MYLMKNFNPKILFLGEYTYPIILGSSTHKVQKAIFDRLSKLGFVCYFYEVDKNANKINKLFSPIKLLQKSNNSFVYTGGIIPFLFFIVFRVNIVHFIVQRRWQYPFLILVFVPWIKTLVTFHDTLNFKNNPYRQKGIPKTIHYLKSILAYFCDNILLYNVLDKDFIPQKVFNKSLIVKNGIEIDDNLILNVYHKENFVLYAGGFKDFKGYQILLKVFDNLQFDLYVCGENGYFGIEKDNIHFLGRIDSHSLAEYIKKAKIVIIPSLYESYSILALEAMYYKTPLIISKNCGISNYLSNYEDAIIVDSNNEDEIRNAINLLYANEKLYAKISEKAYLKVKEFTWDLIIKEYLKIYCNLWERI